MTVEQTVARRIFDKITGSSDIKPQTCDEWRQHHDEMAGVHRFIVGELYEHPELGLDPFKATYDEVIAWVKQNLKPVDPDTAPVGRIILAA